MGLPSISNYGRYASGNYGAHCLCVEVAGVTVWFSYSTPVAFRVGCGDRVVRENDWQSTTGKHLNWIDGGDKKGRVSGEVFDRMWNEQVEPLLRGLGRTRAGERHDPGPNRR